jgi:hypothetical protein
MDDNGGYMRELSAANVAQLIERFLDGTSLYPQEWNDFVETPLPSNTAEAYRKRCYELDPLVNRPGEPDAEAVSELRGMIEALKDADRP